MSQKHQRKAPLNQYESKVFCYLKKNHGNATLIYIFASHKFKPLTFPVPLKHREADFMASYVTIIE